MFNNSSPIVLGPIKLFSILYLFTGWAQTAKIAEVAASRKSQGFSGGSRSKMLENDLYFGFYLLLSLSLIKNGSMHISNLWPQNHGLPPTPTFTAIQHSNSISCYQMKLINASKFYKSNSYLTPNSPLRFEPANFCFVDGHAIHYTRNTLNVKDN